MYFTVRRHNFNMDFLLEDTSPDTKRRKLEAQHANRRLLTDGLKEAGEPLIYIGSDIPKVFSAATAQTFLTPDERLSSVEYYPKTGEANYFIKVGYAHASAIMTVRRMPAELAAAYKKAYAELNDKSLAPLLLSLDGDVKVFEMQEAANESKG